MPRVHSIIARNLRPCTGGRPAGRRDAILACRRAPLCPSGPGASRLRTGALPVRTPAARREHCRRLARTELARFVYCGNTLTALALPKRTWRRSGVTPESRFARHGDAPASLRSCAPRNQRPEESWRGQGRPSGPRGALQGPRGAPETRLRRIQCASGALGRYTKNCVDVRAGRPELSLGSPPGLI